MRLFTVKYEDGSVGNFISDETDADLGENTSEATAEEKATYLEEHPEAAAMFPENTKFSADAEPAEGRKFGAVKVNSNNGQNNK